MRCTLPALHNTTACLQRLSCKPRSEVLHMLHARAMGSFARGKLDCGDIDFIISPGPECRTVGLGPLLAAVLQHLAERGYITQVGCRYML